MTRKLLPWTIALLLASPLLHAQTSAEAEGDAEAEAEKQVLDTVITTGTRRQDRTVAESLAPIDVLQPDEITNAGTPELQAVLTRTVPSFNYPRSSITDASDHVRPAQLRGLAPDQTLVLVNGKRRHRTAIINVNGTLGRGSSPVDLNTIPTAAIQRIEVLRDGASAQYGSDAIAGVINVVLKDDNAGGSADLRTGQYDFGDGEMYQVAANTGFALGESGFINITAEWRDKDATNRSAPDRRQQYPLINGAPDPREASVNRLNHRFGDADTRDGSLFFNAALPLVEGWEFYSFGSYSARDGNSAGFFRRALDARNIPAIYPDGFLPQINSDVQDVAGVLGFRGDTESGWSYDISFNVGQSKFDFQITNSLNVNLGPTSPTEFYAGTLEAGQWAFNLDARRGFEVGFLDGLLNTAVGFEYREEDYTIGAGEPSSFFGTGSQVFPGFRPSDARDAQRENYALYADVEGDVNERLTLGAALRFEDYSDFGSANSGKLSGRFALAENYALRATYASGFRAPNLQQQFYSTTATNFINVGGGLQPFDVRTFAVNNPVAQALGAEPLKAEESDSFSVGFVAEPLPGLSFTLDAYRIDIDDRIILSENLTGAAVRSFLAANGFPGTDGGRYFTNAVDTRTKGFDFVGRYNFDIGDAGQIVTTLGYNRNDTDVERIAPNPPELSAGNLNLQRIGRVEIGRITVGPPKDKIILGGDWFFGDFTTRLTATRYGEWALLNVNPALDEFFDPQWVLDLAISYQWGNTQFTIGSENLNNQYPRRLREDLVVDARGFVSSGPLDNSFTGILPYARGEAPFGFNGRFYYAKLSYSW